jgi:hypothetical protein
LSGRQVPLMTGTVKNEGALQLFMAESMTKGADDYLEQFWNLTGPIILQVAF